MKQFLLTAVMLLCSVMGAKAEVDPNFYIYICFGQSNMEGNAQWEAQDVGNVDERFQMLATCNFTSPSRQLGKWYKATCPIVSPVGKLGPTDYFGRTMVQELPDKKIGVIAVAMGGSPIEMFDKDLYKQKYQDNYNEWWAQIARNYYGENPYGRIIEMAKKAQEVGIIKGILLHQGCSNCADPNWPNMVKKIYKDMLRDLGLRASDVHLYVGEVERKGEAPQSGGCESHNVQVNRIPEVIPTGHVVSSEGLPGNGTDPWHFSAAGYRTLGKRYAEKVLEVMNNPAEYNKYLTVDERYTDLSTLAGKTFAIVNESEVKAFFGPRGSELGFDKYSMAFDEFMNDGYQFKLAKVGKGRGIKLVTPEGADYEVDDKGTKGYLNSQAVDGTCCFLNGLGKSGQRGYDIQDGAQWDLQYEEGKGWSIKNVGTGKYLKDAAHPAMYDDPTYFTFCTLKETDTDPTGITNVRNQKGEAKSGAYTLDGRRVNADNLRPGLYIINGKKVVIK